MKQMKIIVALFVLTASFSILFGQSDNSQAVWSRVHVDQKAVSTTPANINYLPASLIPRYYKLDNRGTEAIVYPNVRPKPTTNSTQSEMSIDMNPTNNEIIYGSANATNSPVTTIYGTGIYFSTNAGVNWTGYDNPPFGTNSGDPAAVIGANGNFYIGFIDGGSNDGGQGVATSTNNGSTWSRYIVANAPPGASDLLDKNHMYVDKKVGSPYKDRVYAAWTDFISGGANNYKLGFKYSTNGGQTWSTQKNISAGLTAYLAQGVNLNTGPNGEVYAAWAIYEDGSVSTGEDGIGFNVSTDGGETWGTPRKIYSVTNFGIRGTLSSKASIRVSSFPSMTVNRNTGVIYMVFPQKANITPCGNSIDIVMIKSTDGGTTWSAPVRVNNDELNNSKDQYYPWATVDQATGNLYVDFYDSRNVRNDSAEVYMAILQNGGTTFENIKVSDAPFKPKTISGLASGYQGDYIGIAAVNGVVYPFWCDDRTGLYQGWLCKVVVATYPLNPFNLQTPTAGTTLNTFPNSSTAYEFNWDTSSSTATYKVIFGTNAQPRKISLPVGTNKLVVTSGQLDNLLENLGVAQGDSLVCQWDVWAYRNNPPEFDTLKSANGPRPIVLKRGVPQLLPFSLVAPADNSQLITSANNTSIIQVKWTKSGEGIRYRWQFKSPAFPSGNTVFNILANNSGYDTVLTIPNNLLDAYLSGIGLNTGDSISGQWKVFGFRNPQDSLGSVETFNLVLKRQALGEFLVVYDSTSANCRVSKDSVLANLNRLNLTYDIKNRGGNTSTITFSMRGYKKVIWLGEGTSFISTAQKDSLKNYLASGGLTPSTKAKLLIYSEDVGYNIDRSASSYYDSAFAHQVLGFYYVLDRPSSGGAQGIINRYTNATDSISGSGWPDVLRRNPALPNTYSLYRFRTIAAADTGNVTGRIGPTFNVAVFGHDLEALRPALDSPPGSPVQRMIEFGLSFVNEQLAPPTPAVAVAVPNGGENWQVGQLKNITWSSTSVTSVKLEYSTDNGTNWTTISASVPAYPASYSWNVPNTPSTQCLVKITDVSNATLFDVSNAVFTISTPPPQIAWEHAVTVKDNGNLQQALTMGQSAFATNGIDIALGEISLPPAPPAGVFDARFELPVTPAEFSYKDYRKDTLQSVVWVMKFQPGAGGYPFTISWNAATLPQGTFMLKDVVTGTIINVDMKTQSSVTVTNTGITALKIEYTKQTCVAMNLATGWNMVAVPLTAPDMSASALFPQANSQVYGFNNGYVTVTTLSTGKGYWVRYPSAAQFNICGTPAGVLTVPLVTGWNLVGVYNNAVPVSSITTTPAGIINSVFYEFNNGYVQANTLNAGKGFWVRATQAGTMNLPAEVLEKQIIPEAASIEKGWGRLLFTDAQGNTASLYTAKDGADLSSFDLPPVPPAGIFDVRYESQRGVTIMHANAGQNVILSGAQYPLTLTATDVDIVLKDKATNGKVINKILRNGESVTISNNAVNVLEVGLLAKPTVYELMQNYPNPFNPTTTIRFGLPEKANVTLTVYNQIGERIVTLLQSEKEAGYYSVDWNASNMTSGVYFYEIRTEKFSAVKKLILMK